MSINRDNIFKYFIYIQAQLDIWDRKMTPDTLVLVQKTFEHFVNDLPKNKDYEITIEEINKLHLGLIPIVAKNKDDQHSLKSRSDNWYNQYQIKVEEELPLIPLDIKETLLEKSVSKDSVLLKLLFLTSIFILFYLIYESLGPTIENVEVDDFNVEIIEMDSIVQFSIDITELIESDFIKFSIDEKWKPKTSEDKRIIELSNGTLFYDGSSFGSFEFLASQEEESETSFFIMSKENFWGVVKVQEVCLNVIIKELVESVDTSGTDTKLDTFPSMNYQSYPYPNRTLKWLEKNEKLEKSFLGKYKLPISLLISIFSLLLLNFFNKGKKGQKPKEEKAKFGHPYFWKIKTYDKPRIKLSEHVEKQVHLLRNKLPSGRNKLNLPSTIHKSVKSAGFVSFQYEEESLKTEYLFLIGYRSQSDHIAKLWTEVANSLNAKDINTSIYHYNSDIRLCYNNRFQNGLSPKELYNHYPNSILVVIGEHYNFLQPKTGKLNNWLYVFENWSTRYLLTSKNYFNWDRREEILGMLFMVLPSKISSLPLLQPHTEHSDESNYETDWDEHLNDYSKEFTIDDIRISFTKEQRDWIAACCLFPSLHYDMSIAIGHIVFAHHKKNLSSSEIEEVFSLSWFYEGFIPEDIRTALKDDLETRDQALVDKVRSFLSDENNYYRPPKGSHASDLFREGILINELLNTSTRQDISRRDEINKELNEIYSRGLDEDVQIKSKIEEIKNPSRMVRLRRWLSISQNIKKMLTAFACLIVSYIFLSAFQVEFICYNSFPPIDKILLNDELSVSTFTNVKAEEVIKNVVICKTTLGETEENIIWDENFVRTKIFLDQYEDLQIFMETNDLEDKYDAKFLNNLTVDVLNKAIQQADSLKGLTASEIRQDTSKIYDAILFCKMIDFSQGFFELQDDTLKHDFEDTLSMSLRWCADNDMTRELLSVGIYGKDTTAEKYNSVKNKIELLNAIVVPESKPNYALEFDGKNDFVEVVNVSDIDGIGSGDFTFEAWVNGIDSVQGLHPQILSTNNRFGKGFMFGFHDKRDGSTHKIPFLRLGLNYTPYPNQPNLLDGQWHHFAVTKKGAKITYYADGEMVGSFKNQNIKNASVKGSVTLLIGKEQRKTTFNGMIDDVCIWNLARTPSQIKSGMNKLPKKYDKGLIACWPFNEGEGLHTKDLVGRHDGRLGSYNAKVGHAPKWKEIKR